MRAFQFSLAAATLVVISGFPTYAQPVHPITLEVESGVHQFEIHKVDPDSVSVKLGSSYKFNFTKKEVRSATSEVVGAAVANARVLLSRTKSLDLDRIGRLAEDLERSAKELAGLSAVYDWLIPETTATWGRIETARRQVVGTREALLEAEPYKRTIDRYLAGGYPFPEDWKVVFDQAHEALSKIAFEDVRESEIADLSRLYERFEDLTNRQTDRSLSHIEDLRNDIKGLIDSEKLTNGLWGQLRVRIDRSLARIPEGESRKEVQESLTLLSQEAEAFLELHKDRLALQEIEERLSRLESLTEIVPASTEAVLSEATVIATLLSGVGEEETRTRFQTRLASIRDRLQETARPEIHEPSTEPPPPEIQAVQAPGQNPPPPMVAPRPSEPAPQAPASVPIYQNRNLMIAAGAGVAVLLLLALLRLLRGSRKKPAQPAAPRKVFKEPPPTTALSPLPDKEDRYAREFSKPAPPVRETTTKTIEPPPETPASPFPDLPPISEPTPPPYLHSETSEPMVSVEETAPYSPEPTPEIPAGDLESDGIFSATGQDVESPLAESDIEPEPVMDSPSPFPELRDEPVPSLDSIFGDPLGYEPVATPSYEQDPFAVSPDPFAQTSDRDDEDPMGLSSVEESAPDVFLPPLEESEVFPWDAPAEETQSEIAPVEDFFLEESSSPAPELLEESVSTSLVFDDMAAPVAKPASSPDEEADSPEEAPLPIQETLSPTPAPPAEPIELEPLLLESQLVELDGSESLDRTGVLARLDQGIPFQGVKPVRMFPLGQAVGLVGEKNGKLELISLDRAVDGSLTSSTTLLDAQGVYSVSRRFGVYWVHGDKGVSVYESANGRFDSIEAEGSSQDGGKRQPPRPSAMKHVYRPVNSYEDRSFLVRPEGQVEGYRFIEDASPRKVERLWRFPSDDGPRKIVSNAVPLGDRLAVVDSERNLILVEPSDGRVYWEGPLQDLYLPPTGPVVLASIGNRLVYVCMNVAEGMWVADFAGPGAPSNSQPIQKCKNPSLFAMDDGVLLLSESEIALFEDRDLTLGWSLPLGGAEPIDLSVDRSQIAVLLKEPDGHTRALVLGKNSGSVLWETEPEEAGMIRFAGAVVQDGNLLLWGEDPQGDGLLRMFE